MNDNLSKPITLIRAEFISNLIDLINNSTLPSFILEHILKDVYLEVSASAQKQYQIDKANYEQLVYKRLEENCSHNDVGKQ